MTISLDWIIDEDGVEAEGTDVGATTGVDADIFYFVDKFNFGNPRCSNIFGCITTKIGFPPANAKGLAAGV